MSRSFQDLASRLRVYLIADFTKREPGKVLEVVSDCLSAGVTAVQYRNKAELSWEQHRSWASRLLELTRSNDALLFINDRLDLAMEVGADGAHLGPDDMAPRLARAQAGDGFIIGGSTGTAARAQQLAAAGCDYLGVGAVFDAVGSKPDASAPRGPEVIAAIKAAVDIPLVGIGGIDCLNAGEVFRAGADGVAVIRALLDALDPVKATMELVEASRSLGGSV